MKTPSTDLDTVALLRTASNLRLIIDYSGSMICSLPLMRLLTTLATYSPRFGDMVGANNFHTFPVKEGDVRVPAAGSPFMYANSPVSATLDEIEQAGGVPIFVTDRFTAETEVPEWEKTFNRAAPPVLHIEDFYLLLLPDDQWEAFVEQVQNQRWNETVNSRLQETVSKMD